MTLKLSPTTNDDGSSVNSFKDILEACIGFDITMAGDGTLSRAPGEPSDAHRTVTELFDQIAAEQGSLNIVVGSGQNDVVIDLFRRREVDVGDLLAFPASPGDEAPNITTRCEMLAHILAEYLHALQKGHATGQQRFDESHRAGLDAQTRHRERNNQQGRSRGNGQNSSHTRFGCAYTDGQGTVADLNDGNVSNVRPR